MIAPLQALGGVFFAGFILAVMTPAIRDVVQNTLTNIIGQGILLNFLMVAFIPFMWFLFILASALFLFLSVRGGASEEI
jgi:hypothetical protein